MKFPTLSIIIATLNSEKLLPLCLGSIKTQNYPRDKIEVLVIDGGSTDRTLDIAEEFSVDRIVLNPLRTAEAAYAIAVREARNEILAFIDSDNVLTESNWLRKMVKPLEDDGIVGTEPLYYTYRKHDNIITKYCALIGMNDPIYMYVGNYDRFCVVTGRWTESPVKILDENESYIKIKLENFESPKDLPTIGANGFLVRRLALIESYPVKDYWIDLDAVYSLVRSGHNEFAKVKVGIVHLFAGNVRTFFRKQKRRIKDYLFFEDKGMRMYPWKKLEKLKIMMFIFFTIAVIPLLLDVVRGYRRIHDRALLFHIPACWITLLAYGSGILQNMFGKEMESRTRWRST